MKNKKLSAYGCDEELLTHITCSRLPGTAEGRGFSIDGNLEKYPWSQVERSAPFVDMVTGAPALLETRCAAVWDEDALYIAFWVSEPDIQAQMTERDSSIYLENDVEVFIGGQDCYYEFQVNALGTVYEVFYIWQEAYKKGGRFDVAEFNLLSRNVDVLGGFQDATRYEKHPRGKRWAFMDWDFPGMQSAVKLDGTLNDSSDIDKGWTVEIAFPRQGLETLWGPGSVPLKEGNTFRIDFSRFEKLSYNGHRPAFHPGWSLNPHDVYDSHIPGSFSYVHLTGEAKK